MTVTSHYRIGPWHIQPLQDVWVPVERHIALVGAKPHGLWGKSDREEAVAVLMEAALSGKEQKSAAAAESIHHSLSGDQTALVVQPYDAGEGGYHASSEELAGDQIRGGDQACHC
jgi:hypothetical protein